MQKNDIRHIAIIMDGNRRWAEKKGLRTLQGHKKGAETVKEVIKACREFGVRYLTLYAFSTENWKRPKYEVGGLMFLLKNSIEKNVDELARNGIRLRAVGRLDKLPGETRKALFRAMEKTSGNSDLELVLALNYGGRMEIVDAARKICQEAVEGKLNPADLDEKIFREHIYAPDIPDPDILIRTSGELRISNFLLWQISYSELWFTEKFWPEFGREEINEAIQAFRKRERRFGSR